jgi:hypothetical protein
MAMGWLAKDHRILWTRKPLSYVVLFHRRPFHLNRNVRRVGDIPAEIVIHVVSQSNLVSERERENSQS